MRLLSPSPVSMSTARLLFIPPRARPKATLPGTYPNFWDFLLFTLSRYLAAYVGRSPVLMTGDLRRTLVVPDWFALSFLPLHCSIQSSARLTCCAHLWCLSVLVYLLSTDSATSHMLFPITPPFNFSTTYFFLVL